MEIVIGLVIGVVILIVILYAVGSLSIDESHKDSSGEIPIEVSVETRSRSNRFTDSDSQVDTGDVREDESGGYVINPKAPVPITLVGCTLSQVTNIKQMLDGEARWERHIEELTFLLAQNNIRCSELEEWISQVQVQVANSIEQQREGSSEWPEASERDRADLGHEFRANALAQLSVRPSNKAALETLLFRVPSNIAADDELLMLFSDNNKLYKFYIRNLGRRSGAVRVGADDHARAYWEALVEIGLARRGKDIPAHALLETMRVKDLNEIFTNRLDKKLTRKVQAVEFAARQPDVLDVLSEHISFREMFQIDDPGGIDVSEVKACYEYAEAQAEVIRDTYVSGYRTLDTIQDARDVGYDAWEIEAEDCCSEHAMLHGKRTKRRPSKLPPFHMGCTCSLRGVYDWAS